MRATMKVAAQLVILAAAAPTAEGFASLPGPSAAATQARAWKFGPRPVIRWPSLRQSVDAAREGRDDAAAKGGYDWTPQTLSIALPALGGMLCDPALSLVDTLFVGRLPGGSVPLAALGACTSIFHLSFHCFRATTVATSSLVAGALVRDKSGAGKGSEEEESEADRIARTSVRQACATGAAIAAGLLLLGPRCLAAMGVPASDRPLHAAALAYLNHRAVAAPAVVVLAASEGVFRGRGDVVFPWKVSGAVALANLALDPFCMFGGSGQRGGPPGLGMGIKGAAVATALSQAGGAALYVNRLVRMWTLRKRNNSDADAQEIKRKQRAVSRAILKANVAMVAKQGSLLLGWAYATARATRLGTGVVAAHQVALSVWLVLALVLEGAGVAAQVLMAREWEGARLAGAKEPGLGEEGTAVRSLSRHMAVLSLGQGLLAGLTISLLGRWRPSLLLTRDPAVRGHLLALLPHLAAQMPLVSATLVTEALAAGGGRFRWLAGGTAVSSVAAAARLRGATSLVEIWSGGIVVLFLGRFLSALLAVLDMNGVFRWRHRMGVCEAAT